MPHPRHLESCTARQVPAPPPDAEVWNEGSATCYAWALCGYLIRWRFGSGHELAELVVTRDGRLVDWRVRRVVLRKVPG